ncbi:MAG: protein kinase family protein [Bacteroidota bacterium]
MKQPNRGDYIAAISAPPCVKDPALSGGRPVMRGTRPLFYAGGFAVVFPFITRQNQKYAVRCWVTAAGDLARRAQAISAYLKTISLPYFVGFEYQDKAIVANGSLHPIIRMEWVEGQTLMDFVKQNLNAPNKILAAAEDFKQMVAVLHQHQISHGDLQHENIMVKGNGNLVLVDYDSLYTPVLKGEKDTIKGLPSYQHPARKKLEFADEKVDYFSELVIYVSLLAIAESPVFQQQLAGDKQDELLIKPEDIHHPERSALFSALHQSSNTKLRKLSLQLYDYCRSSTLDGILPLESVVEQTQKRPWDDKQQIIHATPVEEAKIKVDRGGLFSKMQDRPAYTPPSTDSPIEVDPDSITQKFTKKKK